MAGSQLRVPPLVQASSLEARLAAAAAENEQLKLELQVGCGWAGGWAVGLNCMACLAMHHMSVLEQWRCCH